MKIYPVDVNTNTELIKHTLETNDLEWFEIYGKEIDFCCYWYVNEDYEGSGEMLIMKNNGNWYLESLSHCSCYGPLDNLKLEKGYAALDEINEFCTPEYYSSVLPLIMFAKSRGYK